MIALLAAQYQVFAPSSRSLMPSAPSSSVQPSKHPYANTMNRRASQRMSIPEMSSTSKDRFQNASYCERKGRQLERRKSEREEGKRRDPLCSETRLDKPSRGANRTSRRNLEPVYRRSCEDGKGEQRTSDVSSSHVSLRPSNHSTVVIVLL